MRFIANKAQLRLVLFCVVVGSMQFIPIMASSYGHTNQVADTNDRMEIYEQQLQNLTNRIEILEHRLNNNLNNSTNNINTNSQIGRSADNDINADDVDTIESKSGLDIGKSKAGAKLTPEEVYKAALSNLKIASKIRENDERRAKILNVAQQFVDFIKQYPKNHLIGNAYFWLAETYSQIKDYDNASINYLTAYQKLKNTPDSKKSSALFNLALTLHQLGKDQDARSMVEKFDNEFPQYPTYLAQKMEDLKLQLRYKKSATKQQK